MVRKVSRHKRQKPIPTNVESKERKFSWNGLVASNALLVPLITILVYLLCINVELNYLKYFNVPVRFVRIELAQIYETSRMTFLVFLFYCFAAWLTRLLIDVIEIPTNSDMPEFYHWIVSMYFSFMLLMFMVVFIIDFRIAVLLSGLVSIIIYPLLGVMINYLYSNKELHRGRIYRILRSINSFLFRIIVLILTLARMKGNSITKTEYSQEKLKLSDYLHGIMESRTNLFRFLLFGIPLGFFLMFTFIYGFLGRNEMSKKEDYPVIDTMPPCVIIYQTSSWAICSPFDPVKKEVEPIYQVIPLENIRFRIENVGPLHLKPSTTPTQIYTATPAITITPTPTIQPTQASP